MTDNKEKITLEKNLQEQEQLKADYEKDRGSWKTKELELENLVTKKNSEILDLQHANESLTKDRDEWKGKVHNQNKVYQSQEKVKKQNDFLTELSKLQAQKGIQIETNE